MWNDTTSGTSIVNTVYSIKIPAGTTIYEGSVGYQGNVYLGGMEIKQIFIEEPWKGGTVIDSFPLK